MALALFLGAIDSTWQAFVANRERNAAQTAQTLAETKRHEAEAERQRADREASSATAANAEAQRTAYSARMLLAQATWDQSNISRVRALLAETESFPGRGFEWDYWQRQCRLNRLTLRNWHMVWSVACSPDGRRIATGRRHTITLWEADTGRELLTLKRPRPVHSFAILPDGRCIVSGDAGGGLAFWSIAEPGQGSRWLREERENQERRKKEGEARIAAKRNRQRAELATLAGPLGSAPKHEPAAKEWPLKPGDPGVIRQWLVLAPIPFEGDADLNVLKQQIPNAARLPSQRRQLCLLYRRLPVGKRAMAGRAALAKPACFRIHAHAGWQPTTQQQTSEFWG